MRQAGRIGRSRSENGDAKIQQIGTNSAEFQLYASVEIRHFCWRCSTTVPVCPRRYQDTPLASCGCKRRRVTADNLLSRDDKRSRRTDKNQDVRRELDDLQDLEPIVALRSNPGETCAIESEQHGIVGPGPFRARVAASTFLP